MPDDPEPHKVHAERLRWTHFSYCVKSKDATISGDIDFNHKPLYNELVNNVLVRCAKRAYTEHLQWDPFNVKLLIKPK